jgi:hypothetical protein
VSGPPFTAHFVVLGPDGRLLLDGRAGATALPAWTAERHLGWNDTAPVAEAAAELLGTRLPVLRCLWSERASGEAWHGFYELGPPPAGRIAPPLAWVDPVAGLLERLSAPERRVVERRLADGQPLEAVAAWAHPEWLGAATAWLDERLASLGRARTGDVEQLRVWSISTVLRAPTAAGSVYLKSVPPLFAAEPPLTRELARRHPGRVPDVLAVDEERRLLLMAELPGGPAMSELDPDGWETAVRAYAQLQIAWVGRWPQLLALGCPDRRLDVLGRELAPALRDLPSMLPGEPHGLTDEELDSLPALEEALRDAVGRLSALDLPDTLDHGDLHADNVRIADGDPVFFDWTDGCLTVPFFSLVPLLEHVPAEAAARLRDAYLEEWEPHLAGAGDAGAAFELGQLVGLFHLLVSYRRILAGIDAADRWQWRRVVPYLARQLLQREPSG